MASESGPAPTSGMQRTRASSPRGLAARVPAGRLAIAGLAAIVPLTAVVLVVLDARASGRPDPTLAAAGAGFVGAAACLLVTGLRRTREAAAIVDAVRAAAEYDAETAELMVDASLGTHAASWNSIIDGLGSERNDADRAEPLIELQAAHLDAMSEGVVVCSSEGRVLIANTAAATLAGIERDRADSPGGSALLQGELAQVVERVVKHGGTQRIDLSVGTDASPQQLRVRASKPRDLPGQIVMMISDVTRQSAAEASRGEFLARAAHELRAPLTNIKLYAEQAADEGGDADPELVHESLNVIARETLRLERTVSGLLRVSELESGALRRSRSDIRIDDMLTEIVESFRAAAHAKGLTLGFEATPKLPVLNGDRDHIELLIQNLVGNAIKYTPEGGSVSVKADATSSAFELDVTDTGIGIASGELDRVFETFYRSEDDRVHAAAGSGLGLSLAREIARSHGGDITLESELNRGSTFTLRLPLASAGSPGRTDQTAAAGRAA
ncbi:MAG: ATP-binding protein [Planctomycetota bacterium]